MSDVIGKKFHSWLRAPLVPHLERHATAGTCGGIHGRGTDVCSHLVRSFLEFGAAKKLSTSIVFANVIGAFDVVVRETLMASSGEVAVLEIFRRCGLSPEQWQDLQAKLEEASILHQAGVSRHLETLLCEAHEGAWNSMDHAAQVIRTYRGTKPGDPLGDILYNFVSSAVLKEAHQVMSEEGLLVRLPAPTQAVLSDGVETCLTDATYADDTVAFLADVSPAACIQKTARTGNILFTTFQKFGMCLNPKPGKTEVLLCLRGKAVRETWQSLYTGAFPSIDIGVAALRVVEAYKHMGA